MHGHLDESLKPQLVASQECNVAEERAKMWCMHVCNALSQQNLEEEAGYDSLYG